MTEQEQQVAIAEFDGWEGDERKYFPDYLHDLNAIHGAWCLLNSDEKLRFKSELWDVVKKSTKTIFTNEIYSLQVNATAQQRSEALLRVIGKWKD